MARSRPHSPDRIPSARLRYVRPASLAEPVEVPPPSELAYTNGHELEPGCRAFRMGQCYILVGRSPKAGWHLSISTPSRLPSWEEVKEARYRLLPDNVTMAMLLPPTAQYVDLHPRCLHLWQVGHPTKSQVVDPRGHVLGVEVVGA